AGNAASERANGFAMDVRRYLADEPVLACPPSVGYRFRKFARRNKVGLAVAALVLFFLMLLGSGVGWAVRDHAARQGRIGAQADLILDEVEQLEKERRWPEALAAARRAEAVAASGADAPTRGRVRQALHALQFICELEELHLRWAYATTGPAPIDEGRPHFHVASGDGLPDLYAAAFRDFGVDVEALPVEEASARLRARPALAVALSAAL